VAFNLSRQGLAGAGDAIDRERSRREATTRLDRLALEGHGVARWEGPALAALLPFDVPGLTPRTPPSPKPRRRGLRQKAAAPPDDVGV
jgi:hypothetical protein